MVGWLIVFILSVGCVVRAVAEVHCGGHMAPYCEACPREHGQAWCNGECTWNGHTCVHSLIPSEDKPIEDDGTFALPPDTRPPGCESNFSDDEFADLRVSIVIPWLKEEWIHIRDTMQALLHFTPQNLIEEYLWISDGNPYTYERELKAMSEKVRVVSTSERQGLIRAKMKGVQESVGPVVVFMEAHCIVNKDWVQPLLRRIALNPKVLAMPILDSIPQARWGTYYASPGHIWRYEWNLNLISTSAVGTLAQGPEPWSSPGTSGGILAMKKDWFQHLGLFDEGMLEWGGDHFELTMKVWRCGGRIEVVPCSRIGHLFRDPAFRPYPVEVNQVVANYNRLANVWLKDHLDYFYRMKPEARQMPVTNMEALHEHHDKLACKNMSWYLDNVDHELAYEMDKICHPYVSGPDRCKGPVAPTRITITKDGLISQTEYLRRKHAAEKRLRRDETHDEL